MGNINFPWNNKYPYVNDEELNLDWILKLLQKAINDINNFIGLNTIKYADPILWDITKQYEANTVVVDPETGNAFLSTKAVPYGTHLNNTDYWTQIYNYADVVDVLRSQIAHNEGLSTTASQSYNVGDLVFSNTQLYRVIAPMIAGDSFVVDSNVVKTTIDYEFVSRRIVENRLSVRIDEVQDNVDAEALAREAADGTLQDNIDAEALAREAADGTLQDNIDAEALAREAADGVLQDNIDAETNTRQIVENRLSVRIDDITIYELPEKHGAVGDGVTDDTVALQATIDAAIANGKSVYLQHSYKVDSLSINGGVQILGSYVDNENKLKTNIIVANSINIPYGQIPITLRNISIYCTNQWTYAINSYSENVTIDNCNITSEGSGITIYGALTKVTNNYLVCSNGWALRLAIADHMNINDVICNNVLAGHCNIMLCESSVSNLRPEGIIFSNNNTMCTGEHGIHIKAVYHICISDNTLDQMQKDVLTFAMTQTCESIIFKNNYVGVQTASNPIIAKTESAPYSMMDLTVVNNHFFGGSHLLDIDQYFNAVLFDGNRYRVGTVDNPIIKVIGAEKVRIVNNYLFNAGVGGVAGTAFWCDGATNKTMILANNMYRGAKNISNYDASHLIDDNNLVV